MMRGSKFLVIAALALALILGTRWCILVLYSETHKPASSSATAATTQLAHPVQQPAPKLEIPYDAMRPPLQEAQTSAGS